MVLRRRNCLGFCSLGKLVAGVRSQDCRWGLQGEGREEARLTWREVRKVQTGARGRGEMFGEAEAPRHHGRVPERTPRRATLEV